METVRRLVVNWIILLQHVCIDFVINGIHNPNPVRLVERLFHRSRPFRWGRLIFVLTLSSRPLSRPITARRRHQAFSSDCQTLVSFWWSAGVAVGGQRSSESLLTSSACRKVFILTRMMLKVNCITFNYAYGHGKHNTAILRLVY